MEILSFVGVLSGKVFQVNPNTGKYRNTVKSKDPMINDMTYCEYTLEYMLKNTPTCYVINKVGNGEAVYHVDAKTELPVGADEHACQSRDKCEIVNTR